MQEFIIVTLGGYWSDYFYVIDLCLISHHKMPESFWLGGNKSSIYYADVLFKVYNAKVLVDNQTRSSKLSHYVALGRLDSF